MQNFKEQLIQLVEKLETEDPIKEEILQRIEMQGITPEILEQTGALIKKLIEDYEQKALEEENKILQELERIKVDYAGKWQQYYRSANKRPKKLPRKKTRNKLKISAKNSNKNFRNVSS